MTAAATHEITATIPHGPLDVLRHSWVLAKRSLVKTWRTPEGLIDVTLSPIMFTLLFTYIFGGAIAGSTQDYLPLLVTGLIGQNIAFASVGIGIQLNADIEKGIFDRFKSLPISRIAPLFGAAMGDIVRSVLLISHHVGHGLRARLPRRHRRVARPRRRRARARVLAVPRVGTHAHRSDRPVAAGRPGHRVHDPVPSDVRVERLRSHRVDAQLARAFANANPLSHLVEALRALWNDPAGPGGVAGGWQVPVAWTLLWCAIFVAVFAPLAIRAYNRKA